MFYDEVNQQDIESQGATLTVDYDLGFATLTSITGYETLESFSRSDIDGGFGASFAPPFRRPLGAGNLFAASLASVGS